MLAQLNCKDRLRVAKLVDLEQYSKLLLNDDSLGRSDDCSNEVPPIRTVIFIGEQYFLHRFSESFHLFRLLAKTK